MSTVFLPSKQAPLDEVKPMIYDIVFSQKFKVKFNAWIEKLKSEAFIEIK